MYLQSSAFPSVESSSIQDRLQRISAFARAKFLAPADAHRLQAPRHRHRADKFCLQVSDHDVTKGKEEDEAAGSDDADDEEDIEEAFEQ